MLIKIDRLINKKIASLNQNPILTKNRRSYIDDISAFRSESSLYFVSEMDFSEKYKILEKLGTQKNRKFGDVFLASKSDTNELCVLKAVKKSTGNNVLLQQLQSEASFDFNFKGLPKIQEIYESDQEFLFVRNFVEGDSIDSVWGTLKKSERHPFLAEVIKQLISIFEELKKHEVVHCDLKPSNLIISQDGTVHLIDFGLALRTANKTVRETLFPLGFAAPELLLNRLHLVDERTDFYALGILIWRLYAGKLPLTHPNPSIFTNLQLTHPLPESFEVSSKIQPLLAKLSAKYQFKVPPNKMKTSEVDTCLKEGMDLRYDRLQEFHEDFIKTAPKSWFRIGGLF